MPATAAQTELDPSPDVSVFAPDRIDGVVPGVRGQRAFPTRRGLRNADPFLMLDQIGPQRIDPSRVIDGKPHPHRGFETVSIILEGELDHVDSQGNRRPLRAGDVLFMHAGSGIVHGGDMRPDRTTGEFHEFQLWVNVSSDQKMAPPSVQHLEAGSVPVLADAGVSVRVLSGEHRGTAAAVTTTTPTTILHTTMQSASRWATGDFPAERVFVYVIRGSVKAGDAVAKATETLELNSGARGVELRTGDGGAELLLLAGRPLGEPIAFGGPFVMNTQAEIEQAFADYEAGTFGTMP